MASTEFTACRRASPLSREITADRKANNNENWGAIRRKNSVCN
jgi:hypothetical protein